MQSRSQVILCAQCGQPLKTIPGKPVVAHLPILCKECFGLGTYERKGRSWLDMLHTPVFTESSGSSSAPSEE